MVESKKETATTKDTAILIAAMKGWFLDHKMSCKLPLLLTY